MIHSLNVVVVFLFLFFILFFFFFTIPFFFFFFLQFHTGAFTMNTEDIITTAEVMLICLSMSK